MANDPRVLKAFCDGIHRYGAGTGMNPPLATTRAHEHLQDVLAEFHGTEAALVFSSCTAANLALLDTVVGSSDMIFSDEMHHASIIDGCRLSRAQVARVAHRQAGSLLASMTSSATTSTGRQERRLFITDGIFSMEGYSALLPDVLEVTRKLGAMTAVDECHAAGVVGATGRGTSELHGCMGQIDYITGTLSKAFGAVGGGYICASEARIARLRQRARLATFSYSMSPAAAAAAATAVSLARHELDSLERLRSVAKRFRQGLVQLGFKVIASEGPITPVVIGDARKAESFSAALESAGVYVPALAFPVVPLGEARLRAQLSAAHSDADIELALQAFERLGRVHHLI